MKKSIILLTISMLILFSFSIYASSEYNLKFGHVGTTGTSFHATATRLAELVNEYTDGNVELSVYPNGELGSELDMFEQVRNGSIDFCIAAPGQVVEYSQKISFLSFPYLFDNREHWERVLTSDVGEKMKEISLEETDVRIVGYIGGGVRNVVSRKPIRKLEDFENFLMRVHPTDIALETWRTIGVKPTTVAWSEIYNALQLGVIDGLENEAFWIQSAKFYEQAPYIVETKNKITVRPVFMSDKTYNKLPEEYREAIIKAAVEACEYGREVGIKNDEEAQKTLAEKYDVEFIEIDRAKLLDKISGIRKKHAEKLGLTDIYERVLELR